MFANDQEIFSAEKVTQQYTENEKSNTADLPILSGMKDAYNSSLDLGLSKEMLDKLRQYCA
ncbi:hypothetical protein [Aliiglaciecola sp. LCG003]|uniref:hypothetical protein n=1 Tax=Aliiglaciecola sp. LCG003 TaxID=3053655 RepID=UPI0025746423|nr:hypothetical protein [Aliiglaciecola sp. LCG003]WJG09057.1 hypothetical protein QR722_17270 [Aliiglaciecola sp. LCG003]